MKSFADPGVGAVFDGYPTRVRKRLLAIRGLIFDTAASDPAVGQLEETLKWGQPAYLTPVSGSGSTIRLGWTKSDPDSYAVHFICTTTLVERFRTWFPETFVYEGNRSIVFGVDDTVPTEALAECLSAALTYHRRKK